MCRVSALRVILVGSLFASLLFAQRDLATITGTITDAQNASVANAKVTIVEDATGLKYNIVTGSGGEYSRPALKPGVYSVEVEASGFKRATQRNVILTAGDRVGVNIQLTLGEITQSVEVSAQAPLLQTETTILGAAINAQQMSELPLGGQRTFTYLGPTQQ
jgi:hypothetical protein